MKKLIEAGTFVRRQTAESQFTHFDGTWDELERQTERAYKNGDYSDGYRPGVWLVHMPEEFVGRFFTYNDYPMFEGMKLDAVFKKTAGREHEPAKVQVMIREPKLPCKFVDIVVYAHETLLEDHKESELRDSVWEIVSINGRLNEKPIPMDPMTIVRNWKHLPGGTAMPGATPERVLEQLCQAIMHKNGLRS